MLTGLILFPYVMRVCQVTMRYSNGSSKGESFLPHCDDWVSRKIFLAHKRVYYDSICDQWVKKRDLERSEGHMIVHMHVYLLLLCL